MQRVLGENITDMARFLGCSRQAIYAWPVVPWKRVRDVARFTGLTPHDIRPDLYPRP